MSISSSRIPDDLYHEILMRLPVKSILKCKCVCKSWFSIITNPNFAKSHLQQNKNNSSSNILLVGLTNDRYVQVMHSIGYDLLEASLSSKKIMYSAVIMRCPFKLNFERVRLFGSCNGLVFLCHANFYIDDNDDYYDGYYRCKDFLCVWNPATGEHREIPYSPNIHVDKLKYICICGLGYDGESDNYKFVIGMCPDYPEFRTLVEVFSLRLNSWETIETPYTFTTYGEWIPGVLVNGDLHWIAKRECEVCIVYLDSSSDTPSFKEIQLPLIPNLQFVTVGALEEGCLCVVGHNADPLSVGRVEVWEMQVYGVPESWTRRYIIYNKRITRGVLSKHSSMKITRSFKNGKIVFVDWGSLVLYDPKNGTAIERNLLGFEYCTSEVNYTGSLVPINTGTSVGTELLEESTEHEA